MKILVTGANGFLGHYLIPELIKDGSDVLATGTGPCRLDIPSSGGGGYKEMDITDSGIVSGVISSFQPALIIHAGAMTKPDECELQQDKAYSVNVQGTRNVLDAAGRIGARVIFISTDFIFDGVTGMYAEEDPAEPVNYYGKTKLEAEKLVSGYAFPFAVIRTVLVYGEPLAGRSNILSVVKEKLQRGESYNVVDDQFRTPTWVGDLVAGIRLVIQQNATGIWHISGSEMMTPYEMACRTAAVLGYDTSLLNRVTAATFTQPAIRPRKTGFSITKAKALLGYQPHSFEEGLRLTFHL